MKKIVIVGGGAGGLEMATQLGISWDARKKPKSRWSIVTTAPVETAAARSGDWLA